MGWCHPHFAALDATVPFVHLDVVWTTPISTMSLYPFTHCGVQFPMIALDRPDVGPPFLTMVLTTARWSKPASRLSSVSFVQPDGKSLLKSEN
jgi:hypothetical protein